MSCSSSEAYQGSDEGLLVTPLCKRVMAPSMCDVFFSPGFYSHGRGVAHVLLAMRGKGYVGRMYFFSAPKGLFIRLHIKKIHRSIEGAHNLLFALRKASFQSSFYTATKNQAFKAQTFEAQRASLFFIEQELRAPSSQIFNLLVVRAPPS
jgi:hypothetical protein